MRHSLDCFQIERFFRRFGGAGATATCLDACAALALYLAAIVFSPHAGILSVRVSVTGPLPESGKKSGTLLVANHVSWFDVALIGAIMPVSFMAKSEVKKWPLFGQLAWLNNALL